MSWIVPRSRCVYLPLRLSVCLCFFVFSPAPLVSRLSYCVRLFRVSPRWLLLLLLSRFLYYSLVPFFRRDEFACTCVSIITTPLAFKHVRTRFSRTRNTLVFPDAQCRGSCFFFLFFFSVIFRSGAAKARVMAYFGEGHGPIHVDNVKCTGAERSLADCIKQPIGSHDCRHSEDAGVICNYGQRDNSTRVKGEVQSVILYSTLYGDSCRQAAL